MDRQIWNPKSKETPAFAVPSVSQSCCGGSSALVKIRNSFLVGWQSVSGWGVPLRKAELYLVALLGGIYNDLQTKLGLCSS